MRAWGERGSRVPYIDGLRAVAVLSVVFYHAAGRQSANWPYWLHWTVLQGAHGVDLFFVLSGFCLSFPTIAAVAARKQVKFSVDSFLSKRLIRIVPPYYASILLIAAACAAMRMVGARVPSTLDGVKNVAAFLPQFFFFDSLPTSNPSFWSLAIEARWYLVFPLLLILWFRSKRAFGFVALLSMGLYLMTRDNAIDLLVLPSFMIGVVAAYFACYPSVFSRSAPVGLIVILILSTIVQPNRELEFTNTYWLGWPICAFFLVVSAGEWPLIASVLAWRPLAAIGLASYSIYLVHEPCVSLLEESLGLAWPVAAAAAIAVGFTFWLIVERIFETPSVKAACVAKLTPLVTSTLRFLGMPSAFALDVPFAAAASEPAHFSAAQRLKQPHIAGEARSSLV